MSKSLYGAVQHRFNEQISGFVRGYGYDNRTGYDGFYSYDKNFNITGLPDTRKLYSQTWDTGLRYQEGRSLRHAVGGKLQPLQRLHYDHAKGSMRFPPARMILSNTICSGAILSSGSGTVSAGADWQDQQIKPGTASVSRERSQRNTGIYLTGQQLGGAGDAWSRRLGDDGGVRLARHVANQRSPKVHRRIPLHRFPMAPRLKRQT